MHKYIITQIIMITTGLHAIQLPLILFTANSRQMWT